MFMENFCSILLAQQLPLLHRICLVALLAEMLLARKHAFRLHSLAHVLALLEHPNDIGPQNFLKLLLCVPPLEQLAGQNHVLAHVFQPPGEQVPTVVIPSNSDVVNAGNLHHMVDVVGDFQNRGCQNRGAERNVS